LCGVLIFFERRCGRGVGIENMYENSTKEELIDKIQQLERHVVQLKNVIAKSQVLDYVEQ